MYNPPLFRETNVDEIAAIINGTRLTTVVSNGASGLPEISHLPLIFDRTEGPHGTLYGHFAKANAHCKTISGAGKAMAIFMGIDAYVSPTWYPTKQEHHKHVPTWNYEAVHATCAVEVFDDTARLREVVTRLTKRHEDHRADAWTVEQAPPDYLKAMLDSIVGLVLRIEKIECKRKLSQNRAPEDRKGVRDALSASSDPVDRKVAEHMAIIEAKKS